MLLKTKDLFTVCTIILGFLVLPLAYTGEIFWASMMILIGGAFDLLDGVYARLTKTGNKFGAEFDCIADLIIYSMAPGVLLFFVYKDYNIYLASVVGILPLLFGCIRLARFNVKRIEYPGFWMGLPRPGSAVAIVGLVNSQLFARYDLMIAGAVFVLAMSVMNVTIIPYMGHHKRKFGILLKTILVLALLVAIAALFYGYFWDVLLVYALLYLLSPVYAISRKQRKKINKFITEWKSDSE
jgi:CDP-diacylglycerol--serine O-phosphatidyltransferase